MITFLIDVVNPGGGAQKVIKIILSTLQRNNIKANLIVIKKTESVIDLDGLEVHYILEESQKMLDNSFFILDKIAKIARDSDILVSFMDFITSYYTSLASSILKIPYYCFVRCEPSFVERDFEYASINHSLYEITLNKASKVICNSKRSCDDVINNFGISRDKVELLYNPIDTYNIDNLKSKDCDFIKNRDEISCFSVGRLVKQKNYKTIINAFNILNTKDKRFHLYIIGDGAERCYIENYIKENNITNVTLLGFRENVYSYLKYADIFIHAAYFEGFPNSVLEAAYIGIPLVLSNIHQHLEIFDDASAVMFDTFNVDSLLDAIFKAYSNRVYLGNNAKKMVEKYSVDNFGSNIIEIFR